MTPRPRIYIVDDDEVVLLSLEAMLTNHGYQVSCFSSAEEFLSDAGLEIPGCLITDLQMPGINGVELQQRLAEQGSPLAVVVATGVADTSTVTMLEQQGVALLEKPYDHRDLLGAVEAGLKVSHLRWQDRDDASDEDSDDDSA